MCNLHSRQLCGGAARQSRAGHTGAGLDRGHQALFDICGHRAACCTPAHIAHAHLLFCAIKQRHHWASGAQLLQTAACAVIYSLRLQEKCRCYQNMVARCQQHPCAFWRISNDVRLPVLPHAYDSQS